MRFALSTCILLLLLTVFAHADAGHQADLKMVIDFGDLFGQIAAAAPSDSGDDGSAATPAMPPKMEMTGKMYWTDNMMRLDLDPIHGMSESTITDTKNMVSYKLDHDTKTATKIDLSEFSDQMNSAMDMPDPESMAADWDGYLEALKAIEGATINELAPKEVNGFQCKGVSFVVTPPAPADTGDTTTKDTGDTGDDGDMAGMLGAMTAAMGGYSGEVWVADNIRMPISMKMSMMMMDYNWDLTNVTEQDLDPSLFQVPEDYEVVEMQLPDMSEMPDLSGEPTPAPAPEPAPSGGNS